MSPETFGLIRVGDVVVGYGQAVEVAAVLDGGYVIELADGRNIKPIDDLSRLTVMRKLGGNRMVNLEAIQEGKVPTVADDQK